MEKIAILIYSMAGGGAERVVSILLEELKNKYDTTLVLMNPTVHYDLPENQKIVYLKNSSPIENSFFKLIKLPYLGYKYKQLCYQNNINITLSFLNRPNYIALFSKLFGNQSEIIIHERSQPSLQHEHGLQGFINRYLIKLLYPKADTVIANSLGNSIDLQNQFGIDAVHTINNPFDLETINTLSQENLDKTNDEFTFITVGRLDKGKNHRIIIEAMQYIDANLWIIGEGPLQSTLEKQIEQLKLKNKVFLLGRQENPFKYMNQADCFVFGSSHEGFPNVLVEALACGLPVISTDCNSGPREILAPKSDQFIHLKDTIEFAQYGILTPINDTKNLKKAMHIIMANENIRNSYKTKSRQRAQDFSKEKITLQFIKEIEGTICAE